MPRIRTIKPDAFRSRHLAQVDRGVRWTYAGLWCLADDKGRLEDDVRRIWADLYLYDGVTPDVVEADLKTLASAGLICRYEVQGRRFLHVPTFNAHQVISRPNVSKWPPCPLDHTSEDGTLFPADELETHGAIRESARSEHGASMGEGKGREGKGTGARGTRLPPDWEPSTRLVTWARAEVPGVDLKWQTEQFRDYWTAKAGRDATKLDWDATWRKWMRKASEDAPLRRRAADTELDMWANRRKVERERRDQR